MTNPYRGEVRLVIDGQPIAARLTLGALAELEEAMGAGSLVAVAERFESGAFSARDVLAVLTAAARAGGWRGEAADMAAADLEGGVTGGARAAAQLLARAFGMPG